MYQHLISPINSSNLEHSKYLPFSSYSDNSVSSQLESRVVIMWNKYVGSLAGAAAPYPRAFGLLSAWDSGAKYHAPSDTTVASTHAWSNEAICTNVSTVLMILNLLTNATLWNAVSKQHYTGSGEPSEAVLISVMCSGVVWSVSSLHTLCIGYHCAPYMRLGEEGHIEVHYRCTSALYGKNNALLLPPVDVYCHSRSGLFYYPSLLKHDTSSSTDARKLYSVLQVEWEKKAESTQQLPRIESIAVYPDANVAAVNVAVNVSSPSATGWLRCLVSIVRSADELFPTSTEQFMQLLAATPGLAMSVIISRSQVSSVLEFSFEQLLPLQHYRLSCVTQDDESPRNTAPIASVLSHQHYFLTNGTKAVTFVRAPDALVLTSLLQSSNAQLNINSMPNVFVICVSPPFVGQTVSIRPVAYHDSGSLVTFSPAVLHFSSDSTSMQSSFMVHISGDNAHGCAEASNRTDLSVMLDVVVHGESSAALAPQYTVVPSEGLTLPVVRCGNVSLSAPTLVPHSYYNLRGTGIYIMFTASTDMAVHSLHLHRSYSVSSPWSCALLFEMKGHKHATSLLERASCLWLNASTVELTPERYVSDTTR